MVSVIIPAHNEEKVISRALHSCLGGYASNDLEVIVCCNGCTDQTAGIARSFGDRVRVIEIAEASKCAALNAGDAVARSFPRIYMDADVRIDPTALHSIERALDTPGVLAVAPKMRVDLSGSAFGVRAFYRIWLSLPYHENAMIGSGLYALSKEGRSRFSQFPEIISDDGFVRRQFSEIERRSLPDCHFEVCAPADIYSLIRVKSRVALGNRELKRRFGGRADRKREARPGFLRAIIGLSLIPSNLPKLAIYGWVQLLARLRSRLRPMSTAARHWERDESSRHGVGAGT